MLQVYQKLSARKGKDRKRKERKGKERKKETTKIPRRSNSLIQASFYLS